MKDHATCPDCGGFYSGMTCDCQWVCHFGCINPHFPHMREECFTAEEADDMWEQMQQEEPPDA